MAPNTIRSTKAAAFLATVEIELPVPAADGTPLAVRIKPVQLLKLSKVVGRLPGEFGKKKVAPDAEDQPERSLAETATALGEIMEDLEEMRPVMVGVVELAMVEPLFWFDRSNPAPEDYVPWDEMNPVNQTAIFNGVMKASMFAGGAAEEVAGFRVQRPGGRVRGVGSMRPREVQQAASVRGFRVPGGRKPKRSKRA